MLIRLEDYINFLGKLYFKYLHNSQIRFIIMQ